MRVFVVQAVLARDERRLVGQRQVVAGLGGQDERAQRFRALGVAPAEVIEQGDAAGMRPTATQLRTASSMTQAAMA